MRAILLIIFFFGIQTTFTQTINSNKAPQLFKSYKEAEDSIATRINPQNTIIYKICEGEAFYLIQENAHWTGYYIKNVLPPVPLPPIFDTLKNGDIIEYKSYEAELQIFNADSTVKSLFQHHVNDIHQMSEKALQAKFIRKGKKKGEEIIEPLPTSSHDCNCTIVIYGQKNISATYRWSLVISEEMHTIPTLRIFYETQQILINSVKNYYGQTIIHTYPSLQGNQKP